MTVHKRRRIGAVVCTHTMHSSCLYDTHWCQDPTQPGTPRCRQPSTSSSSSSDAGWAAANHTTHAVDGLTVGGPEQQVAWPANGGMAQKVQVVDVPYEQLISRDADLSEHIIKVRDKDADRPPTSACWTGSGCMCAGAPAQAVCVETRLRQTRAPAAAAVCVRATRTHHRRALGLTGSAS
jgi:hypothetical protein